MTPVTDKTVWHLGWFYLYRDPLVSAADTEIPEWKFGQSGYPYYQECQCENDLAVRFDEFMLSRICPSDDWGGIRLSYSVRCPSNAASIYSSQIDDITEWHQDGTDWGLNDYLVTWSNTIGTLIRDKSTGDAFQAEPNQVLAFSNHRYEHRTPDPDRCAPYHERTRWFVRTNFPGTFLIRDSV